MSLPLTNLCAGGLEEKVEQSRLAQRRADKWLIAGTLVMGANVPGHLRPAMFLWGLVLLRGAAKAGRSVRPVMVTLIGLKSPVMPICPEVTRSPAPGR